MVNYTKLTNAEKSRKWNNINRRCEKKKERLGTNMCYEWKYFKEITFYSWLDEKYYVIDNEQMDVDTDILFYGNKQYSKYKCLVVPHSINVLFENLELGKTQISCLKRNNTYVLRMKNGDRKIVESEILTFNDALDRFCEIKKDTIIEKANLYKERMPEKVYKAVVGINIKEINAKFYR